MPELWVSSWRTVTASLPGPCEERQVVLHFFVEIETPLVNHDHRHGGRGDDLGQAGQIVDRVRFDCRCVLVVGKTPKGMEVRQGSSMSDGHDASRERSLFDEFLEKTVHLIQPPWLKPDILRLGGGQGHRPPRDLEALADGVLLGESHRQLADNVDLAEERGGRCTATRLRGPEGTDVDRHVRKVAQEIGIAERGDDDRAYRSPRVVSASPTRLSEILSR